MYKKTTSGILYPSGFTKPCTQCKIERDICDFSKRKNRKTPYYSICKVCMRLRSKKWMYQNPEKYLSYLSVRKSFERKVKTCVACKTPGEVHWHRVDNRRGMYHDKCYADICNQKGIIHPTRIEQLRRIAEGVV